MKSIGNIDPGLQNVCTMVSGTTTPPPGSLPPCIFPVVDQIAYGYNFTLHLIFILMTVMAQVRIYSLPHT